MTPQELTRLAEELAARAKELMQKADQLAAGAKTVAAQAQQAAGLDPFVFSLTVFALACFVGYYVVWKVTPALHSPLMSVTNAISSVIIVGALLAAGPGQISFAKVMGFLAIALAAVNIFGGFIVTQRMISMFKKKSVPAKVPVAKG
ncbi:MAG: NAD(P) transhydrogenase subunit alpha [Alphaproteobacteria bacterium]